MLHYQPMITVSLAIAMTLLLSQCGVNSNLHYTVPDNYQGFLVIRYKCPGGDPLIDKSGERHVVFQNDGTACIEDHMPSNIVSPIVETKSGQQIQFRGSPFPEKDGYALVDISVTAYGPGETVRESKYYFSVLWVGELDQLNQLMNSREYEQEKHEFISRHFDLRDDY